MTDEKEQLDKRVSELEAALDQCNRRLKEARDEVGSLNYSISHDLKAPLRNIFGFAHLLGKKYRDRLEGQGLEYLQMIMSGVERMGVMIEGLLKLSRIGRVEMRHETVDLSAIATSIVEALQKGQPERRAEIEIQGNVHAQGDPYLLEEALSALLENAWKFTGGKDPAVISFGTQVEGGKTFYFVRDNGAGFACDQRYRLFSPFQRLHLDTEFPGAGIGLALVKKIVQRHDGHVDATGTEGEGAIFSFTLEDNS